jgi:hypothetical protein
MISIMVERIRDEDGSLNRGNGCWRGTKNPHKSPLNQTGFKRPPAKDPDRNERTRYSSGK